MGKGDRKRKKRKKRKNKQNFQLPQSKKINGKVIKNLKNTLKEDLNKKSIAHSSLNVNEEGKRMSYEIAKKELKYNENNPIHFLKWATKYNELDGSRITDMDNFTDIFPFADSSDENDSKFKNLKNTEFALAWFKNKIQSLKQYNIPLNGNTHSNVNIENLSGIVDRDKLKEFVENLLPYSFILQAKFKLKSLYFSSDDDNFYLIQNPCLKEKVFKVPMVRGSGWKGVIAKSGKELVNENLNWFDSYVRIFGTGSDEYRKLLESLEKEKNLDEKIINFVLFKLGLRLKKEDIDEIKANPKGYLKKLSENFTREKFRNIPYLQPHKGRAIFYPSYFNSLSLEIINPHSRKTRAGTNPIHYEVVPGGTEGILQIVYIPFDGVLLKCEDLKTQVENDIEFLTKAIEKATDIGIGAKGKLGWGRFELISKMVKSNKDDLKIPVEWKDE